MVNFEKLSVLVIITIVVMILVVGLYTWTDTQGAKAEVVTSKPLAEQQFQELKRLYETMEMQWKARLVADERSRKLLEFQWKLFQEAHQAFLKALEEERKQPVSTLELAPMEDGK